MSSPKTLCLVVADWPGHGATVDDAKRVYLINKVTDKNAIEIPRYSVLREKDG